MGRLELIHKRVKGNWSRVITGCTQNLQGANNVLLYEISSSFNDPFFKVVSFTPDVSISSDVVRVHGQ